MVYIIPLEWKCTFKMRFQKFGHHLWSHCLCTLQTRCHCDTANKKDSTQHDHKLYLKNKKIILLLHTATNYLWLYLVYTNTYYQNIMTHSQNEWRPLALFMSSVHRAICLS
jgi:hypothetical protein